ncbi:hypothetical protein TNCV_4432251 [Trichonephila clavipes]|nr:hypothetical protein TNCV_4432251 [Trichonephila clavipes]
MLQEDEICPTTAEGVAGHVSFSCNKSCPNFFTWHLFLRRYAASCGTSMTRLVRRHLKVTFGQRWIGRRGSVHWLSRSMDLSRMDF